MANKDSTDVIGKKIQAVPKEPQEIGIDTNDTVVLQLLDAVENGSIDMSSISALGTISQTRESIFNLIDTMAADGRVSAILETYAKDVVQKNDKGQIVWCASDDPDVLKFITYLLKVLKIDKHSPEWVYSLIKYGDIYLQLFRKSDTVKDDEWLAKKNLKLNEDVSLKEDINVIVNSQKDPYLSYVEMVPNPGEMFDLYQHGKTMAYVQAPTNIQTDIVNNNLSNYMTYNIKEKDTNIYSATDFVHGFLTNDNASRFPEEITLFTEDDKELEEDGSPKIKESTTFKVRKGQSLLYNQFRIWRQLTLLENSLILNRVTKSAILRILNVNIGDMSEKQAMEYIRRLKQKVEQKTSMEKDKGMSEYTNPGPVENTVYLPTHNGQGEVTAQILGGEYDPKNLDDVDYFLNEFYGNMRIPKQYFNQTGDSTGFNAGVSLTIINSRYGKEIKSIQEAYLQMLTDLINLFLINRGYSSYINKYVLKMQEPVTQEELDRREDMRNRMGVINDIMQQVDRVVDDKILKLKIVKSLLSDCISEPEVINLLQEHVDSLEKTEEEEETEEEEKTPRERTPRREPEEEMPTVEQEFGFEEEPLPEEPAIEEPSTEEESSYLPSPDEMNLDLTGNL